MFRLHIAGLIRCRAARSFNPTARSTRASAPWRSSHQERGCRSGSLLETRSPGSGQRPGRCRSRRPNCSSRWRFRAVAPPRGSRSWKRPSSGASTKRFTDGAQQASRRGRLALGRSGCVRRRFTSVRRCPISSQDPQSRLIRLFADQPRPALCPRLIQ